MQVSIDRQSPSDASRLNSDLRLLGDLGIDAPLDMKSLGRGLWEIRVRAIRSHRVLYVTVKDRRIAVLHAFTKRTPKTPPAEIETAHRRLGDMEQRGLI